MMMVIKITIIIKGHECVWGTVWGRIIRREGKGKESEG
jgi:hypothetical protein